MAYVILPTVYWASIRTAQGGSRPNQVVCELRSANAGPVADEYRS